MPRSQMQVKPLCSESSHGLERAAFLEEAGCSGYDLEVTLTVHTPVRPSVEGKDLGVSSSRDEQRRGLHFVQSDVG